MLPKVDKMQGVLPFVIVLLGWTGLEAQGQEVNGRVDYATDCREAREQHRPMVIDFGTQNCSLCPRSSPIPARNFPQLSASTRVGPISWEWI